MKDIEGTSTIIVRYKYSFIIYHRLTCKLSKSTPAIVSLMYRGKSGCSTIIIFRDLGSVSRTLERIRTKI
jgi:hypothetical protein